MKSAKPPFFIHTINCLFFLTAIVFLEKSYALTRISILPGIETTVFDSNNKGALKTLHRHKASDSPDEFLSTPGELTVSTRFDGNALPNAEAYFTGCFKSLQNNSTHQLPLNLRFYNDQTGATPAEPRPVKTKKNQRLVSFTMTPDMNDIQATYDNFHWKFDPGCSSLSAGANSVTVTIKEAKNLSITLSNGTLLAKVIAPPNKPSELYASGSSPGYDGKNDFPKRPRDSLLVKPFYEFILKLKSEWFVLPNKSSLEVITEHFRLIVWTNSWQSTEINIPSSLWHAMVSRGHHLQPELIRAFSMNPDNPWETYHNYCAGFLTEHFDSEFVHSHEPLSTDLKSLHNDQMTGVAPLSLTLFPANIPGSVECPNREPAATGGVNQSYVVSRPSNNNASGNSESGTRSCRRSGAGNPGDGNNGGEPTVNRCRGASGCPNQPLVGTNLCQNCRDTLPTYEESQRVYGQRGRQPVQDIAPQAEALSKKFLGSQITLSEKIKGAREFMRWAGVISPHWEEVARLTDKFKTYEIENIRSTKHNPLMRADQMLNDLRSRLGTFGDLVKALELTRPSLKRDEMNDWERLIETIKAFAIY